MFALAEVVGISSQYLNPFEHSKLPSDMVKKTLSFRQIEKEGVIRELDYEELAKQMGTDEEDIMRWHVQKISRRIYQEITKICPGEEEIVVAVDILKWLTDYVFLKKRDEPMPVCEVPESVEETQENRHKLLKWPLRLTIRKGASLGSRRGDTQ